MNYFELYPGDYLRDTTRLSLAEHGAYLRLLMAYYAEEQPLPEDLGELYVIVSAISSADKAAVKKVADRFFPVGEDGMRRNGRADDEIAKAQKRIATARDNGSKGGRPKRTQEEPGGLPSGFSTGSENGGFSKPRKNPAETHSGEALQTPHAITTPERVERAESHLSAREPTEAGRACSLMRQAGCATTNPSHPDLLAALDEGVTPEALGATVAEAIEQGIRKPFAWAITTARGRHAEGPKAVTATARAGPNGIQPMSKTAQGIAALENLKRDAQRRLADGGDCDGPAEARVALAGPNARG